MCVRRITFIQKIILIVEVKQLIANSVDLHQDMKRNFVLDKLLEQGITKSQQGQDIHLLSYEELKYELVLQSFREIDVAKDANRWF